MKIKSTLTIVGMVLLSLSVQAEDIKTLSDGASAAEMEAIIFGGSATETKKSGKTRSFSFTKKPKTDVADTSAISSGGKISLPIQFGSNSANILPNSKEFVDKIGKMLASGDASRKLVVEGHTDAAGSNTHNKELSEQRAQAVKDYLVSNYQISSSRLIVNGKGEAEPLPNLTATDPANRRVQFYAAP
ncbi:MAG: OmpA family protein [Methylococcales bacterium]|nr:OmpA family protein [Methylococcales bacterium]